MAIFRIGIMKVEGKEIPQWAIEAAEIWVKGRHGGFQTRDLVAILDTDNPYRVADRLIQKFKKEGKISLFNLQGHLWWFPKGHTPIGRMPRG